MITIHYHPSALAPGVSISEDRTTSLAREICCLFRDGAEVSGCVAQVMGDLLEFDEDTPIRLIAEPSLPPGDVTIFPNEGWVIQ